MPLGMSLEVVAGLGMDMLVFSWNSNFWTACQVFIALFNWGFCSVLKCLAGLPGAQVQFPGLQNKKEPQRVISLYCEFSVDFSVYLDYCVISGVTSN